MRTVFEPFPEDFPNKGKFIVWTSSWDRAGYSETAQYPGEMPITYPEDATLLEIWLGGYLREEP